MKKDFCNFSLKMQVFVALSSFVLFLVNTCATDSLKEVCEQKIYRECHHATSFTEEELENVRLFLQKKFSKTRPIGEPCKRLHVRKDIKCLSEEEFQDFVAVIKEMHGSGFMDRMTLIHHNSWPAVHKYGVGLPWHRWFIMLFEKEMLRINPKVTLPYWDYFTDFAEPHKSKIWDLFGHAGTAANDFCVADGPFANMTLTVPTPHCFRRQWNPDGTMNPWEAPEWVSAYTQMSVDYRLLVKELQLLANWSTPATIPRSLKLMKNVLKTMNPFTSIWSQYALGNAYNGHFKTHLSVGGFNGDMSRSYATNDPLFYVFHGMASDLTVYQWQLIDDRNLVPDNYGLGIKYDYDLKRSAVADVYRDTIPDFTDVTVKETFQLGYGQLCYVHDQLIKPINEIMRGHYRPVPGAVHRLKARTAEEAF